MAPKPKTKTVNLAELQSDVPDIADLSQSHPSDASVRDGRYGRREGGYGNDFGSRGRGGERSGFGEGYGGRRRDDSVGDDGPWRREGGGERAPFQGGGDRGPYQGGGGDRGPYQGGGDRGPYQGGGDRGPYQGGRGGDDFNRGGRGGDDFNRGGRGGDDFNRRPRDEPGEEDVATTWRTSGLTRKRDGPPPMVRERESGGMMRERDNGMMRPMRAEPSEENEDNWRRAKPAATATMSHTDSAGSMTNSGTTKRRFNFGAAVGHLPEPSATKPESHSKSESTKTESEGVKAPETAKEVVQPKPKEEAPKAGGRFAGLDDSNDPRPARRADMDQQRSSLPEPVKMNRFASVNDPVVSTRPDSRPAPADPVLSKTESSGMKLSDGVVLAPVIMGGGRPKKDLFSAPKSSTGIITTTAAAAAAHVQDSAFQRNQSRTDAAAAAFLYEEKKEKKVKKVNERKRAMMAARAAGQSNESLAKRDPACYKNLLNGSVMNLEILAAHFETVFDKDSLPTKTDAQEFLAALPTMLNQSEDVCEETLVLATLFASLIKEVMTTCEETLTESQKLQSDEVTNAHLEEITDKVVIPAAVNAAKKTNFFLQELAETSVFKDDFSFVAMQTLARLLAKADGPRISASLTFSEVILIGLFQGTALFNREVVLDWVDDAQDDCEGRAGALAQILHLSDALRGTLPVAPEEEPEEEEQDEEEEDE